MEKIKTYQELNMELLDKKKRKKMPQYDIDRINLPMMRVRIASLKCELKKKKSLFGRKETEIELREEEEEMKKAMERILAAGITEEVLMEDAKALSEFLNCLS